MARKWGALWYVDAEGYRVCVTHITGCSDPTSPADETCVGEVVTYLGQASYGASREGTWKAKFLVPREVLTRYPCRPMSDAGMAEIVEEITTGVSTG